MSGSGSGQPEPADFCTLTAALGRSWSDATERIRTRTDTTAKTIGGLGTIGIAAAGLDKLGSLFPLPASPSWEQILALAGVLGGVIGMAAGVVLFTIPLLRVSTPIFFRLDPDEMDDVDKVEREKIRTIFQDVADLNDAENLEVYARRALRLQRVARHSTNAAVKALAETEANEIDGDVGAAQSRAAANVVRRRSHKAFLGRAWRPYALFIASLLAFGVSADYLDSERTARITTAKDCAAAIKIVRESAPVTATLLPEICGGAKAAQLVSAPAAPVSSPDAQLAGAVRDLAARYDSCVAAAGAVSSDCATIRAAMRAAIP